MRAGTARERSARSVGRWPIFGLALAALTGGSAIATSAMAAGAVLPTGGVVAAGSASIGAPNGSSLVISQSSSRAVIDWSNFSIGQGDSVSFANGSGATLNRVAGLSPSVIDGLLSGTGSVYLVNPNGVVIGKNGVVRVGGTFAASTLDVANGQFMGGGDLTFTGDSNAAVINYGKIGALGGDVAMIAAKVVNSGEIDAANGDVGLIAGYQVTLRDASLDDGKFAVVLGGPNTSVTNGGLVQAADAELRANGGSVYALAGNTSSVIKATGVASNDGKVFLVATGGTLDVAGTVQARGANGAPGQIETSGASVVVGAADIDAGPGGYWLLDPNDLTIDQTAANTIGASLNAGTSVVQETTASGSGGAGDITVDPNVTLNWSTAADLTLSAYRDIDLGSGVQITSTGGGSVTLRADNTGTGVGTVSFASGAAIATAGAVDIYYNPSVNPAGSSVNLTSYATPTESFASAVSGGGALNAYMLVNTVDDLQNMQNNLGGTYALGRDVDAAATAGWNAGVGFVPVGGNGEAAFTGVFEGDGHTVSNLFINYQAAGSFTLDGFTFNGGAGLFGLVGAGGVVRDITLAGANVTGGAPMANGALAGFVVGGEVINASSSGSVSGGTGNAGSNDGGLIGIAASGASVTGSNSSAMVSGGNDAAAGGLIGSLLTGSTLTNSYASGSVSTGGGVGGVAGPSGGVYAYGGGLVGTIYGFQKGNIDPDSATVSNSYATGSVTGGGGSMVGGFAGLIGNSQVSDAYATGSVSQTATGQYYASDLAGGFAGFIGAGSAVSQAYSSGSVSAFGGTSALYTLAGGFVGDIDTGASVANAYSLSPVSAAGAYNLVGGFDGYLGSASISDVYASGLVSAGGLAGGLLGYAPGPDGSITNSYWDTGTTGKTGVAGYSAVSTTTDTAVGGNTSLSAYAASSYTNLDTSANGPWVIFDGSTRPMLRMEASSTISNGHQLQLMALDPTASYVLASDIDLSATANTSDVWNPATGFVPVGGNAELDFTGAFDGAGHTLSNLFINYATVIPVTGVDGFSVDGEVGLFGTVATGGVVKNLTLANAHVMAADGMDLGALAGAVSGQVSNVTTSGVVSGGAQGDINTAPSIGGVVGVAFDGGMLSDLHSSATVSGGDATAVGGAVGGMGRGTVLSDSSASGDVSTGGGVAGQYSAVGGLVGSVYTYQFGAVNPLTAYVSNSFATGSVTGGGGSIAGGFVGSVAQGVITTSYATGSVTQTVPGQNTDLDIAGGFVGIVGLGSSVSQSYSSGAVRTISQSGDLDSFAGGFVGLVNPTGSVSDSYSLSSVTGDGGFNIIGGFAGLTSVGPSNDAGGISTATEVGSINNVYASGRVSGSGLILAGLVGLNQGSISNGYWDVGTTGQSLGFIPSANPPGSAASSAVNVIGLSGSAAYAEGSYGGFDFSASGPWVIFDGATRPMLRMEASTTISNGHQLQLMALDPTANYVLANDIDLSATANTSDVWNPATGFVPVGGNGEAAFTGNFNGAGHTLSNLFIHYAGGTIVSADGGYQVNGDAGLFGLLGTGAVVHDLSLSSVSVTGGDGVDVGALAGYASGAVLTNLSSSGAVATGSGAGTTAGGAVGGLIGGADTSTITGATSSASVTAGAQNDAGGLLGSLLEGSSLSDASASGAVVAAGGGSSGSNLIGGLIGVVYGYQYGGTNPKAVSVTNATATGSVTAGGYSDVGGLVGYISGGQISNAKASGQVSQTVAGATGAVSLTGGFVGASGMSSTIDQSYATGQVSAAGNGFVGGFAGDVQGAITTSYATGGVTQAASDASASAGDNIGGFAGLMTAGGTIGQSYSAGAVSVATDAGAYATSAGGFVGQIYGAGAVSDSYSLSSVSVTGTGPSTFAAGFVGLMQNSAEVQRVYASGQVTAPGALRGGLGGLVLSGSTITDSYWDEGTTTVGQAIGYDQAGLSSGLIGVGGSTGLSAYAASSYTNLDTSSTGPWVIFDGSTRPMLRMEASSTISNGHQLQLMALDPSANYVLANDIDLSATSNTTDIWNPTSGFVPVGGNSEAAFTGTFDGAGHTLSNLFINYSSASLVTEGGYTRLGLAGLFGEIGVGGVAEHLALTNVNVTGGDGMSAGALAASVASGQVTDVTSSGSVTVGSGAPTNGGIAVGGLIGAAGGGSVISGASSSATVSGGDFAAAGGLIGSLMTGASVNNSSASGDVSTGGAGTAGTAATPQFATAGGLVGTAYGYQFGAVDPSAVSISNSHASGAVSGGGGALVGGFVGVLTQGQITTSYATGTVTQAAPGQDFASDGIGGFAGIIANNATVSQSYSSGVVTAGGSGSLLTFAGGFAGDIDGSKAAATVSDSYSLGSVSEIGANALVGGFAGVITAGADIERVYASGHVAGQGPTAGLVGVLVGGLVADSYWDEGTTGQINGYLPDGGTAINVTGVGGSTGVSAYAAATYGGFDLNNTWVIADGSTRPILRMEYSTTISNGHQLQLMALDPTANYVLANDIDLSATANGSDIWNPATGFVPVGGNDQPAFTGTFDGAGHTLSNLFINNTNVSPGALDGYTYQGLTGLFGLIGAGGLAEHVALTDVNVTGADGLTVGALAGDVAGGQVIDATSSGSVTGGSAGSTNAGVAVGGLIGAALDGARVSDSSSSASVHGGDYSAAGGLIGSLISGASVDNSSASGDVSTGAAGAGGTAATPQYSTAGGLIGTADGYQFGKVDPGLVSISNSSASGSVSGGGGSIVGGFVGVLSQGQISTSYATGAVTQTAPGQTFAADLIGGFVGVVIDTASVSQSYSSGAVTAIGGSDASLLTFAGGFVGDVDGTTAPASINDSYSLSAVTETGPNGFTGGFAGLANAGSDIERVYAAGRVAGLAPTAGLVGLLLGGTVGDSYWDENTTGQTVGVQYDGGVDGAVGLSTSQLQSGLPAGFSAGVWSTVSGESYPYLNWQFSGGAPQVVSGFAYQQDGVSAYAGGVVDVYYGGSPLTSALTGGATTSGANGYYYYLLAPGTLATSTSNNVGALLYAPGGSPLLGLGYNGGGSLADGSMTALDIADADPFLRTSATAYSALTNDLSATFGAAVYQAATSALGQTGDLTQIQATGAFTIDVNLSSADRVQIEAGGDLTIASGASISSSAGGDAIVLAADGNFINNAGAGALSATNGRWLIYSQAHGAAASAPVGDVFGGLSAKSYYGDAFTFGAATTDAFAAAPNAGNRFVYGYQPTLTVTADTASLVYNAQTRTDGYSVSGLQNGDTASDAVQGGLTTASKDVGVYALGAGLVSSLTSDENYALVNGAGAVTITPATLTTSLIGPIDKTYDGTTAAAPLVAGEFQLSGMFAGDGVGLSDPTNGTYASKHVGNGILVTYSGLGLTGTDAADYRLASTSASGAVGEIDPKLLTASLIGSTTKVYNGSTAASLTTANYSALSGVVAGDAVSLSHPTAGTYAGKDVGASILVTANAVSLSGASASDYVIGPVTGAIGVITPKTLTASLSGAVSKTYDGTTAASVLPTNEHLSGVVSGDTVALSGGTAAYGSKDVGSNLAVTVSGVSLSGAQAGDYVLASGGISANVGKITPAILTVTLQGTVIKTYDGTTAATLGAANYLLSGVVAADAGQIALNAPTSGTYDTKHVGTGKTIKVTGLSVTGADAGDYTLATTASGATGEIDALAISVALTGTVSKTYNGATDATLVASNYQLSGVLAGDTVKVVNPGAGTYAGKDVGTGIGVSVSGVGLTGSGAGDYVLVDPNISGSIGTITPATLVASLTGLVDKTYDGTTTANLVDGDYQLSGVLAVDSGKVALNDPLTGTYNNKNVGTGKAVTVTGLGLTGLYAGDYVLKSTSVTASIGEIDAKLLNAALTGLVDKTYNGTTAATLTAANYSLMGLVGGDAVSLNNPTTGVYAQKDVGSGLGVTVSGVKLTGAGASNYTLGGTTSLSANIGEIDPKTLSASLVGTASRVYDSTRNATLTAANYRLTGVVAGDAVALNDPGVGTYDTKDVGTGKGVTVNGVALTGAAAGDYALVASTLSGAIGVITPYTLTVSLTGVVSKSYDGTTVATLTAANYAPLAVFAGDSVALNDPASGTYASKGSATATTTGIKVTVTGLAISGSDAGDYKLASTSTSNTVGTIVHH